MWVGDDIGLNTYAEFISEFKKLTENGLAIFLQYGNRDFLMQKAFCQASGVKLLKDITIATLYKKTYILMHGDQLCTDDKSYQRMRTIVRNRFIQWIFLHLCQKRRVAIANKMRQNSKEHTQDKSQQIMDVNQHTLCKVFSKHPEAVHMIHGHTHRPGHHIIEAEHATLNRWVLGDWRPQAQIIKIDASGPHLENYPSKH